MVSAACTTVLVVLDGAVDLFDQRGRAGHVELAFEADRDDLVCLADDTDGSTSTVAETSARADTFRIVNEPEEL
jgi:hypothetical protein